jgi:uncharacterized protein (DUF1501 family)
MLHLTDLNRRSFLQIGGLGLGGLSLPALIETKARAADGSRVLRDRSVIFLFLHGGPSQTETFDPKMTAPAEFRSATGEISTKIPGVTFGSTFPRLSSLADRFAIVRSFVPGDGNHDIKPVVSKLTNGANVGAIVARVAGINHPTTGLPTNVTLFPRAVDPTTQTAQVNFGRFDAVGPFGAACTPFDPSGGGQLLKNMKLSIPLERLDERRLLIRELDRVKWELAGADGLDRTRQQAIDTLVGGASEAFDLSREDAKLIARYDTAPLVRPEAIDKKWNNKKHYEDNAKSLGKLLLLARRLCERGCGFVTVTTNFVWDMHADQNNAGVEEGMQYMGRPFDHAVSAFIEDCAARGLSDKILLVCSGEIGRTPRINARGGRDHWGGLSPLLLSGGGLNMGQVIGQSTKDAGEPATEPYGNEHLLATIMHTLLDIGQVRLMTGLPQDLLRTLTTPQPIPGLL